MLVSSFLHVNSPLILEEETKDLAVSLIVLSSCSWVKSLNSWLKVHLKTYKVIDLVPSESHWYFNSVHSFRNVFWTGHFSCSASNREFSYKPDKIWRQSFSFSRSSMAVTMLRVWTMWLMWNSTRKGTNLTDLTATRKATRKYVYHSNLCLFIRILIPHFQLYNCVLWKMFFGQLK